MDVSGSGWSSGCESGWTLYLDESYVFQRENSNNVSHHNQHQSYRANSMSYEEDLSMVSDASSGPPHFHEDDDEEEDGYGRTRNHRDKSLKKDKRSKKEKKQVLNKKQYQHQHLDDTASSPAISYAKMYDRPSTNQAPFMDFSQNLSDTHFQANTAVNNQYGFWQPSHPYNADSAEPSKLRGRRWE